MADLRGPKRRAYGLNNGLLKIPNLPFESERAPTTNDYADIGQTWIDKKAGEYYVNTDGESNWLTLAGGAGAFSSLSVTGNATIDGSLTLSASGRGVLFSDNNGVITSNNGTNGQLVIAATGADPAFASITSGDGSVVITPGANTLDLTVSGATASTFPTDGGTATPALGATTIAGGTNIDTSGAGSTVTIDQVNNPTHSGLLTAQAGFTMSGGTASITSNTNSSQAIYLHADGGTSEQIDIHSDQSTLLNAVRVRSDVGGVFIDGGIANAAAVRIDASNAAGGLDVNVGSGGIAMTATNGPVALESGTGDINIGTDGAAHTVTVGSTTGAADTTIQTGTGAMTFTAGGAFDVNATDNVTIDSSGGTIGIGENAVAQNINIGTGAAARTITIGNASGASSVVLNAGTGAVNIGSNATAHATTVGSTTGASATTIQAGTGALNVSGGGALNLDAVGALALNSSGAAINIGDDADAQNINIGTGAAARTITIGNATGATSVVVDSGTGNLDLGVNATDHSTRLGSTNGTSALTIQSGTGAQTYTAGGDFDVNAAGNVTIDSTGGTLGIGEGADAQNINIGTGAAARTITIGNATAATALDFDAGTGGITVDSGDAISLDAAAASNFSSSAGDVTVEASTNSVNITGAEAAADAVKLSATHASGGVTIDAGATPGITYTNGTETAQILVGSGDPGTATVDAVQGSIFLRTDGGASTTVYVKTDNGASANWSPLTA